MLRKIRFDTAQANPGTSVSSQFVHTQRKHLKTMKEGFSGFLKVSMNLRAEIVNSGDILQVVTPSSSVERAGCTELSVRVYLEFRRQDVGCRVSGKGRCVQGVWSMSVWFRV